MLNSTGALIREECEIECSRGVFTASPGELPSVRIIAVVCFVLIVSIVYLFSQLLHTHRVILSH